MQSLQDSAHFAKNVVFPGLESRDLTANKTAWIYYGGSYAGAKSAFARKLFPNIWWGAIASSAVTEAVVDFWEYMEVRSPVKQKPSSPSDETFDFSRKHLLIHPTRSRSACPAHRSASRSCRITPPSSTRCSVSTSLSSRLASSPTSASAA